MQVLIKLASLLNKSALFKSLLSAVCMTSIFYSGGVYAADPDSTLGLVSAAVPNLQTMLTNFANTVPLLMKLVTAIAFVMGMAMVIAGILGMKHYGELRTMSSVEHNILAPIVKILVGAALLYLPSAIHSGLSTFWTTETNPYAYVATNSGGGLNATFNNAAFSVIQLIGVIAFIRGLLMLQQASSERAQPGMIGKAAAHMTGGILCINIYNTLLVLQKTVGLVV